MQNGGKYLTLKRDDVITEVLNRKKQHGRFFERPAWEKDERRCRKTLFFPSQSYPQSEKSPVNRVVGLKSR